MSTGRPPVAEDQRWYLEDEREFLVRSLADAEAEHAAGDLSPVDFEIITRRDRERLEEVMSALDGLGSGPEPHAGAPTTAAPKGDGDPGRDTRAVDGARRRRGGRWLAAAAVVVLLGGAAALVVDLTSPRLPGEGPSGSITLSTSQQVQRELAQASVLVGRGKLVEALHLYQQVLGLDPGQPDALAERGWIEYEAGVSAKDPTLIAEGRSSVARALEVDPDSYAAHLFMGTIELRQDGNVDAAMAQYEKFFAEHPPESLIEDAAPFLREAYRAAGVPLPSSVPG